VGASDRYAAWNRPTHSGAAARGCQRTVYARSVIGVADVQLVGLLPRADEAANPVVELVPIDNRADELDADRDARLAGDERGGHLERRVEPGRRLAAAGVPLPGRLTVDVDLRPLLGDAEVEPAREALARRGKVDGNAPLLLSPKGTKVNACNLSRQFRSCAILAFVRMEGGGLFNSDDEAPEVAHFIEEGRVPGIGGPEPKNAEKIERRLTRSERIRNLADAVRRPVEQRMERLSLYSLKTTHITWARQIVSLDAVHDQVGHAGNGVQERHYVDVSLLHPQASADAVWDVLRGRQILPKYGGAARTAVVGTGTDPFCDPTRGFDDRGGGDGSDLSQRRCVGLSEPLYCDSPDGPVAQWSEQGTHNPCVPRSSRGGPTNYPSMQLLR
jgi:hypothetical protein